MSSPVFGVIFYRKKWLRIKPDLTYVFAPNLAFTGEFLEDLGPKVHFQRHAYSALKKVFSALKNEHFCFKILLLYFNSAFMPCLIITAFSWFLVILCDRG